MLPRLIERSPADRPEGEEGLAGTGPDAVIVVGEGLDQGRDGGLAEPHEQGPLLGRQEECNRLLFGLREPAEGLECARRGEPDGVGSVVQGAPEERDRLWLFESSQGFCRGGPHLFLGVAGQQGCERWICGYVSDPPKRSGRLLPYPEVRVPEGTDQGRDGGLAHPDDRIPVFEGEPEGELLALVGGRPFRLFECLCRPEPHPEGGVGETGLQRWPGGPPHLLKREHGSPAELLSPRCERLDQFGDRLLAVAGDQGGHRRVHPPCIIPEGRDQLGGIETWTRGKDPDRPPLDLASPGTEEFEEGGQVLLSKVIEGPRCLLPDEGVAVLEEGQKRPEIAFGGKPLHVRPKEVKEPDDSITWNTTRYLERTGIISIGPYRPSYRGVPTGGPSNNPPFHPVNVSQQEKISR
ncbi:hypothetical protein DSECCO2_304790 [anaerobic digester metagenome]